MTVLFALLAAAVFGAGVAMQQRPASEVPDRYAGRPGLLLMVVRRPLWVAGFGAEILGFVLQVLALRHGSLVLVQPLLTTNLLFTFAFVALWYRHEVTAPDWVAVVAVVVGLTAFLVAASPSAHSSGRAVWWAWALTGAPVLGVLALLFRLGLSGGGPRRAVALGLAAGLGDAAMAVLTKAFARGTDHGLLSLLGSWVPYALCASGIVAVLLTQSAYQTGRPKIALPLITVTDPLVSCGVGVGLFGEAVHLGGGRGPVVALAGAVMAAGLVWLSHSSAERTGQAATG